MVDNSSRAKFTNMDPINQSNQFIKVTYVLLFGLSSLIGIAGNFTILWAFVACRALRALRNAFIVNLTIADLAVVTVTMPMSIIGIVIDFSEMYRFKIWQQNYAGALAGRTWFEERRNICIISAAICAPGCIAATYSTFVVAASNSSRAITRYNERQIEARAQNL
uniref:G-protein coupled receptors family 1 profile domain-containing protein n=1 Tax=Romanomermis culicivorax TaxID=13658 RepID=A0A915I2Q0_ROMCU